MWSWLREVVRDTGRLASFAWRLLRWPGETCPPQERRLLFWSIFGSMFFIGLALIVVAYAPLPIAIPNFPATRKPPAVSFKDLTEPMREEPKQFRANTYLPRKREGHASGSIGRDRFSAKEDLIRVDDPRVWWESEHDKGDTENDHLFHWAMVEPMRRLIELVDQAGGKLKVQDAYRAEGIHAARSLHKEGRAVDLTSEGISLEKLSKLCWAAGFDWVFYESPKRGGAHVHASVRTDRYAQE